MPARKIFLTGATGYIGGSVLSMLLKYPNKYEVSALVRNETQAGILKEHGVHPVLGDLSDETLLAKFAKDSDAVVHAADCLHLDAAQALVRGLKAKNKKRAVFVHTSGTIGLLPSKDGSVTIFDDSDMKSIDSIPHDLPHRIVDNWILDNCANITAAIITPSSVTGLGTGFFNKASLQGNFAKAGVERKKPGYVRTNDPNLAFGNVNIHDLVNLYQLVLDGLLSNKIDSGKEGGFYFGTTHLHSWYIVAQAVGATLHKMGVVDTAEVSPFEKEYLDKYFYGEDGKLVWEGDSRCVANRSKKIGWNPVHPDIFETLEQEVKYAIEKNKLQ